MHLFRISLSILLALYYIQYRSEIPPHFRFLFNRVCRSFPFHQQLLLLYQKVRERFWNILLYIAAPIIFPFSFFLNFDFSFLLVLSFSSLRIDSVRPSPLSSSPRLWFVAVSSAICLLLIPVLICRVNTIIPRAKAKSKRYKTKVAQAWVASYSIRYKTLPQGPRHPSLSSLLYLSHSFLFLFPPIPPRRPISGPFKPNLGRRRKNEANISQSLFCLPILPSPWIRTSLPVVAFLIYFSSGEKEKYINQSYKNKKKGKSRLSVLPSYIINNNILLWFVPFYFYLLFSFLYIFCFRQFHLHPNLLLITPYHHHQYHTHHPNNKKKKGSNSKKQSVLFVCCKLLR